MRIEEIRSSRTMVRYLEIEQPVTMNGWCDKRFQIRSCTQNW